MDCKLSTVYSDEKVIEQYKDMIVLKDLACEVERYLEENVINGILTDQQVSEYVSDTFTSAMLAVVNKYRNSGRYLNIKVLSTKTMSIHLEVLNIEVKFKDTEDGFYECVIDRPGIAGHNLNQYFRHVTKFSFG